MTFGGIPGWAVAAMVLGCAGALVVLHLLRVRPQEVRVITTLFWAHAIERSRARALLERFRHPGTYALLLLICALLSLALGQPRPASDPAGRVWEVIVLDGGMAMQAAGDSGGRTHFQSAVDAVRRTADESGADDRLALVVAGPWPRLAHRFDDPRAVLPARLAGLAPASTPAAMDDALRLAESLLEGRANRRIVVISNRPGPEPARRDPDGTRIDFVRIGGREPNAAILSAVFEPSPDNLTRGRLTLRVGYWGEQPRQGSLTVQRGGGAPLLHDTRLLAPGATADFVLADVPADGDTLRVDLGPADAVDADNHAAIRLPLRVPIRVGMTGSTGAVPAPLRAMLESDPGVRLVGTEQECDIDVISDPAPMPPARPSIVLVRSGPAAPAGRPVRAVGNSRSAGALEFEGGTCGTGASIATGDRPGGRVPILMADDAVLAAKGPRCLHLASALLAEDATANRRTAFGVFLAQSIRTLAGWDADPVVIPPERIVDDPLWPDRAAIKDNLAVMPGSREASSLWTPAPATAENTEARRTAGRFSLQPFEVLLLAALLLFAVEAVLHTRGRIP